MGAEDGRLRQIITTRSGPREVVDLVEIITAILILAWAKGGLGIQPKNTKTRIILFGYGQSLLAIFVEEGKPL